MELEAVKNAQPESSRLCFESEYCWDRVVRLWFCLFGLTVGYLVAKSAADLRSIAVTFVLGFESKAFHFQLSSQPRLQIPLSLPSTAHRFVGFRRQRLTYVSGCRHPISSISKQGSATSSERSFVGSIPFFANATASGNDPGG